MILKILFQAIIKMIDHSENQYALDRNGNRVLVFDVPTGEACDCKCTKCKQPVAAKNKGKTRNTILKPNQRAAHFYHIVSKNCQGETLVHILAKEIIGESKRLVFEIPTYDNDGSVIETRYQEVGFDKVILEKRLDVDDSYIIPDLTAMVKNKKLYIEIVYQNNLSESKRELIIKNKLRFLSIHFNVNYINWNEFKEESQLKEKIRWFLFENELKHQKWIFNPKLKVHQYSQNTQRPNISGKHYQPNFADTEDTFSENNQEIDYELSPSTQLILDREGNERKLQAIAGVLNYSEIWFVESILEWEEKWLYFLDDENFEIEESELQLKPEAELELLKFQEKNLNEWHLEYHRMKRKKFFK